jgi:hypothetical protein
MRNLNLAVAAATICMTLAASSAFAEESGLSGCVNMEQQVKTALASNQQSPNYDAANKEQNYGRQYCTNTFYAQGIDHYDRALALLGTSPSKS